MAARDRSPRRERRPGGGGGNPRPDSKRAPPERRIFVSNIPYEMKWQEVKDMFRDEIGDVTYVQLYNDEEGRPRGCGVLEFASEELVKKAIDKMHRKELSGRKLVVKEDFENERDKFGRIVRGDRAGRGGPGGGGPDRGGDRPGRMMMPEGRGMGMMMGGGGGGGGFGNTYGLSPEFLASLGIDEPLHTRLFVVNLAYSVDEKKLREVFRLAGIVTNVEVNKDKDGKSRGHAVVEFSHPVEAVQAISMFNNQSLFDRKMTVRFDKTPGPTPEDYEQLPSRLPEGLADVGMGLGQGGNPLTNVASNLPSAQNNSNNMASGGMADLASNLQGVAALARQLNMVSGAMAGAGGTGGGMMGAGAAGGSGIGVGASMGAAAAGGSLMSGMGGGMGGGMGMGSGSMGGGGSGGVSLMGQSGPGGGGGYGMGSNGYSGMKREMGGGGYGAMKQEMGAAAGPSMRSSDTVLVRGLPLECTWQSLREGFSHCGDIKYAEMKERGVGLIRFTSERDADRAISMMDKQMVNGRTIDVRLY